MYRKIMVTVTAIVIVLTATMFAFALLVITGLVSNSCASGNLCFVSSDATVLGRR
jgi:hypothetical protein